MVFCGSNTGVFEREILRIFKWLQKRGLCCIPLLQKKLQKRLAGGSPAKALGYCFRWFFNMEQSDIPAPFVGIYPPMADSPNPLRSL